MEGAQDFNEREMEIINFIGKNPGVSLQMVRDSMKLSSSVTTHKIIRNLLGTREVVKRNKRPNGRPFRLFLNKESSIFATIGKLGEFEKVYMSFLRKAKEVAGKDYFKNDETYTLVYDAIDAYRYAIELVLSQSILTLPNEIKDEELLKRQFLTIFKKLADIHAGIASEFREDDGAMWLLELAFTLPKLPPLLRYQYEIQKKYGIAKECAQVIRALKKMERLS